MHQHAEANLAALIESTEDLIWSVDLDYRLTAFNRAMQQNILKYYGVRIELGMRFHEVLGPERAARWLGYYARVLAEGPCRIEYSRIDGGIMEMAFNPIAVDGETKGISVFGKEITERKAAEIALHEAEKNRALLASIVEFSGDAVHAVNLDGTVASWNRGAEQLFGYTSEEMLGKNLAILVPPGNEEQVRQNFGVIQGGCTIGPIDTVLRRRDGTWIDVSLTISPIRNSAGEVVGAAAIARDISQRKQAEIQLRDSMDSLKESQEIGGLGSYVLDIGSGTWTGSDILEKILGIDKEYGHTVAGWTALIHPDDCAMMAAYLAEEVVGKGMKFDKEYRIVRHEDQAVRWVHGLGRLEFGDKGQPVKMLGVIKDITERKLSEMQLRDSEERYRAAFQMNHDAIDICRLEDGRFIEVNEAFVRCTGFSRDEVIGQTAQETGIWDKAVDRQKLLDELRQNQGSCDFETQYQTKNGKLLWGLLSVVAIELDGVPCILSITHDITEAKAAEECMTMAANELRLSEERYRTAFQTSLDAITITRIDDGTILDCNQAFLDTLGYKREDVIGRTTLELGIWADARDRKAVLEMMRRDSSCRGLEVQFRKKNGELFWGEVSASLMDVEGVPCILSITRDLSAAKTAEKTIRSLAFYDPLTGLPNRSHLMERLRQPLDSGARNDRTQALLLVDLDHFKTLNDTLGHQTGDLMLQEAARRIVACTHEDDTVCRLGGDEFVVLLEARGKVAEEAAAKAKAVGEKILASLDQSCLLGEHECLTTASIGIAVFGDRQDSTDEILQQAEIALYQAKAAGRNALRFFSPALQAAVSARATMEEDLRLGIKAKQFLLYYQPQVERGRMTGAEALIRWEHPRRGMVMPNDFIPLAEESRLILPLGDWVLEAACEQITLWAGRKETAHLSVAVNISALQFRQPEFVEHVLATLSRTGANVENLRLELTESMLVENLEDIIAKMTELKSHGVRFSLDDFGTGYSSLTYLKRLPLDRLKIDRSFVNDMMVDATSGAIAQTILSLGRAMGISVIAEGVETEEQRGYLAALGCHAFQGYLFSRPLPLDKFEAFVQGFAENGSSG